MVRKMVFDSNDRALKASESIFDWTKIPDSAQAELGNLEFARNEHCFSQPLN